MGTPRKSKERAMNDDGTPDGVGDCFEVAGNLVLNEPGLVLCHGLVTHPAEGYRHWHAWVERTTEFAVPLPDFPQSGRTRLVAVVECIDKANGHDALLPRDFYYGVGGIDRDQVRRYERAEAAVKMVKTGHYGPWPDCDLPSTAGEEE